jgi:hypothetical protein
VDRLDTLVSLLGGFETGSLVGPAGLYPHLRCSVLRGVPNVLAAYKKAEREAGSNVMLGVKRDNRESVHGPMKVVLTPNIGLEEFWSLHTLELVRPIPAPAG